MSYLLDTQILLWSIREPEKLSKKIHDILAGDKDNLFISIASLWEIIIKCSVGKLNIAPSFIDILHATGVPILPISKQHLHRLFTLPYHHKDPFDRMLVAQAVAENLTLITSDQDLRRYDAKILLA